MAASQALSVLGSIQAKPCVVQAYGCLPRPVCSGVLAEGAAASSSEGILDERLGNAQISQVQLYIAHNSITLEKRLRGTWERSRAEARGPKQQGWIKTQGAYAFLCHQSSLIGTSYLSYQPQQSSDFSSKPPAPQHASKGHFFCSLLPAVSPSTCQQT